MNNFKEVSFLISSFKASEALLTALELELFQEIEIKPLTTHELGERLKISNTNALDVLLRILEKYELIVQYDVNWYNMPIVRDHLDELKLLKDLFQQERDQWSQLTALLKKDPDDLKLLSTPKSRDIDLMDLSEYFHDFTGFIEWKNLSYKNTSKLDVNKVIDQAPNTLILSSDALYGLKAFEMENLLQEVNQNLDQNSYLVLYGPFMDFSTYENLFDSLEMALQTGAYLSSAQIKKMLKKIGFSTTDTFQLKDGNTVFFASKNNEQLDHLNISELARLKTRIRQFGFDDIVEITSDQVVTSPFTQNLCNYGCRSGSNPKYMKKCSHHDSHNHQKTREIIDSYSQILLLCGEPPTGNFQKLALQAQAEAFKSGYYKAFVYWAGPCSLCEDCEEISFCRNPQMKRPSMEGAGIDVFATVKNADKPIQTLRYQGEYIHYFALLLLE